MLRSLTVCRSNFISRRVKFGVFSKWLSESRELRSEPTQVRHLWRQVAGQTRSTVTGDHIFRGPFGDVDIENRYVHQQVWRHIDNWWHKTALVCAATGRSYTYGEVRKHCGRFATALRQNDVNPRDTVAVVLPNIPEYAVVVMGCSEAGVRLTTINPAYTAREISVQIANSEAAVVITNTAKYPVVMESLRLSNNSVRKPVIVVDDGSGPPPAGTINFGNLVADGIEEFAKTGKETGLNCQKSTFVIPYSSGTTGLPKGVQLTHRNIVANICQGVNPNYFFGEYAFDDHQDVVPIFLPMYHIYGLVCCLQFGLSTGSKLILMPQFTSNTLLDVLDKHQTTMLCVVPPVLQLIVNDDRFKKEHLANAKCVVNGAAPVSREFIDKFQLKFGTKVTFSQGYGLSEVSPLVSLGKFTTLESVGHIVPNTEIRIVAQDGNSAGKNLGINEVGEIVLRGPQVMKGYYKNPKATEECMDGEWFKTGDLGRVDEKGQLFITGRLKELIKVQGLQVSPPELENILHGHEQIVDAAVVGVPHDRLGEVPKAFVIPKAGARITEDEVKDYVAKRVAKHKQLGHVVFTSSIPKSPAGKILRKELQKL